VPYYAAPIEPDYDVWNPPPPPPPNEPPTPIAPAYEAAPLTCKHSNEVKTVPREGGGSVQISVSRC
jgi:hypothetical protein